MTQLRESSLFKPVSGFVRHKGYRWQAGEVQFFEYRIDLYGFSRTQDATLAVELKLTNWQRAIQQALIYQLCADYVWIAVPATTIARIDTSILTEHGIGLLSVNLDRRRCHTVVRSAPSKVLRPYYRDEYVSLLLGDT